MKKKYYVNIKPVELERYEIHAAGCGKIDSMSKCKGLGSFDTCEDAIEAAKIMGYDNANGCYYCARECYRNILEK